MKNKKQNVGLFLENLSFGMNYKVLDYSKDKKELDEVAEKHHLVLPSRDLAIFKGVYALVDQENKNGCTLPKEEVEKSIATLSGKAIDFDHLRKKIVGVWLEGKIVGDEIVAYGLFFKSNLAEDYDTITELMNDGNLKISFEAWGNRIETNDRGSYDLVDIHWAGGALLIHTKPAFGERAEVLELAKKDARVLEFAKVMTPPTEFVRSNNENKTESEKKSLELARFYIYDFETILRLVGEVGNPNDKEDIGYHDIVAVDFLSGVVKTQWVSFDDSDNNASFKIYLTPRAEKGSVSNRKFLKIEEDKKETVTTSGTSSTSIVIDVKDKSSTEGDSVNMNKEVNDKMEEKIKQLEAEIAKLLAEKEVNAKETASLKENLENAKKELEAKKTELEESAKKLEETVKSAETEKASAVESAKKEATKVAERRAELGQEFAKDMTDADILNDDKFENAKLKKENKELKEKASTKEISKGSTGSDLTVGSKDTDTTSKTTYERQKRVTELAFKS